MNKKHLYIILILVLISCKFSDSDTNNLFVSGDYELDAKAKTDAKIFFSGSRESEKQAYLNITKNKIQIMTQKNGQITVLKETKSKIVYPAVIRILKNGNFFRFWVGDTTEWIRGPLGEWEGVYEPFKSEIYIEDSKSGLKYEFTIKKRNWLAQTDNTVIQYGQAGSFYEQQVIPGAILEYENKYYMYFMAGMKGNEEGSSRRSIGLAISDNLKDWTVKSEPVVNYEDYPYDNIYINGAVLTPDNKVALMFSAQKFPEWKGFMLATADHPEGVFKPSTHNPVYDHRASAHEFDLIDLKEDVMSYKKGSYRYLLFYAGFNPGMGGDRGYLLYSNNLVDWVSRDDNPIFGPETKDNWDAVHVRPRSLTKIDTYWYLWYEGCNTWTLPNSDNKWNWTDVIGLARSKNLKDWEYHPRNPVLSGIAQSEDLVGHKWVGWPRMVVKDETGYVFFCGTEKDKVSTTYRSIDIKNLVDWTSDIKETISK